MKKTNQKLENSEFSSNVNNLCNELLKSKPDSKKLKHLMKGNGLSYKSDSLSQLVSVLDHLNYDWETPEKSSNKDQKLKKSTDRQNNKAKVKSNETSAR